MTTETAELLARLSGALRNDIGPAVDDEYARTQAFMASVILDRLSREVALGPANAEAEADDMQALIAALRPVLAEGPEAVRSAVEAADGQCSVAALSPLIEALYAWGADEPAAVASLDQIRLVLRRDIDRRMEIAR